MSRLSYLLLGLWLALGGIASVLGQETPRSSAAPDWYDYGRVGRRPTINGRPAQEKIHTYERRVEAIFSDRPVTRRGTAFPTAPRQGVTSYAPVADMLAPDVLAQEVDGDRLQARRFYEEALREYRRGLAEEGWPVEDVGSAIALYLNNHYTIVFGQPMPSGVPYAIYQLFQGILSEDRDFMASSDRERQLLAESLAILATAMYSQYAAARGYERERLRQQSRANLESFTGQSAEEFRDLVLALRDRL
ncbi:MAG: DUF6683 family protein [Acidobacteriota bacterium]